MTSISPQPVCMMTLFSVPFTKHTFQVLQSQKFWSFKKGFLDFPASFKGLTRVQSTHISSSLFPLVFLSLKPTIHVDIFIVDIRYDV
jgi:hypothetical protein